MSKGSSAKSLKITPVVLLVVLAANAGPNAVANSCGIGAGHGAMTVTGRTAGSDLSLASVVVDHYFFDPVLRNSWAVVVDCAHPERPAQMMPAHDPHEMAGADRNAFQAAQLRPWLRAGSAVRAWRAGAVRIELSATAIESAPVGSKVKVRIRAGGTILEGVVRGADSVELTAGVSAWSAQ
jgi:hypothetical protein